MEGLGRGRACGALLCATQILQTSDSSVGARKCRGFFHVVTDAEIAQDCQDILSAEFTLLVYVINETARLRDVKIDFAARQRVFLKAGQGTLATICLGCAALNGRQDEN